MRRGRKGLGSLSESRWGLRGSSGRCGGEFRRLTPENCPGQSALPRQIATLVQFRMVISRKTYVCLIYIMSACRAP